MFFKVVRMKIKNRLILLGIIMGVISCFGLNKLYAANITSAFSDVNINRNNLSKAIKSSTIEQKWLGISEKREPGQNRNRRTLHGHLRHFQRSDAEGLSSRNADYRQKRP